MPRPPPPRADAPVHVARLQRLHAAPGERVDLDAVLAHGRGQRARRQRDGVGVDHAAEVGLLAGGHGLQHGVDAQARRQHDTADRERGENDLARQPAPVEDGAQAQVDRVPFAVHHVHAHRHRHRERGAHGPDREQEGRVVTGQCEPESVEEGEQAERVTHANPSCGGGSARIMPLAPQPATRNGRNRCSAGPSVASGLKPGGREPPPHPDPLLPREEREKRLAAPSFPLLLGGGGQGEVGLLAQTVPTRPPCCSPR